MIERHPVRGALCGALMGLGFALLALIYGLVTVPGPWVPLAIVLVFTAIGGAFAQFWPAPGAEAILD